MDKYEYKVRADEIKSLIAEGEYAEAVKIADTIDWRRVRSVMMLCTISDVYKINRRYQESNDILLLAYEKHPTGRLIVYSLCELAIKMEDYARAVEYFKEFVQIAPRDTGKYILQYRLYEAQEVRLEERIAVLEEFKKRDYREKWAYELAYLYHRIGLATKCVEECDEMYLWFGEGKYVCKALELKALHVPLSPQQQAKYDLWLGGGAAEEAASEEESQSDENGSNQEYGEYNGEEPEENAEDETEDSAAEMNDILTLPTTELPEVKTVDVGQYNTLNLQRELAESMKEVLAEEESEPSIAEQIIAPLLEETGEISSMEVEQSLYEQPMEEEAEDEELVEAATPYEAEEPYTEPEYSEAPYSERPYYNEPYSEMAAQYNMQQSIYDDVLAQEYDGQISLVVPDEKKVEKQITGQLSIEDVMAEWERTKRSNEQKRMEEVRQRILSNTGGLFADFDEATKSGLLEQLEKVFDMAAVQDIDSETAIKTVVHPDEAATELRGTTYEQEESNEIASEPEEMTQEEAPEAEVPETEIEPNEVTTDEATFDETAPEEALSDEISSDEPFSEELPEAELTEDDEVEELEEIEEPEVEVQNSGIVDEQEAQEPQESAKEEPAQETNVPHHEPPQENNRAVRELTDDEKELFGPSVNNKKTKDQLIHALDNMSMAAYTGNVIITGEKERTLELAKNLIREMQNNDSNFSGKAAKISGAVLNKKDIHETIGRLVNGALIIEKAAGLNSETIAKLNKELEKYNVGLLLLMEDTKLEMNKLLSKNEVLKQNFNLRVDIEPLDNEALVAYAKMYAQEMEYSIDEFGILALHTRITEMQTSDHEVSVTEVKELVDEAIYYANRKTPKHFLDILLAKRYDDDDMIIIRESDFMHN
ncbi:MAG: hypothetical protein NC433_15600 [Clostridiales bacterium]|nr:hypothetical protein [Clostridiales bacterium]